ncbi:MAG: hypothetical protein FRX49_01287 [Trebouxia sp. A1-2]|nr:MAG: hypothetical protein FRX49_01287 [Trebouxia sp. A1-2]
METVGVCSPPLMSNPGCSLLSNLPTSQSHYKDLAAMNAEVGQAAQLRFVSPDICDYVQQTNEQIVPILEGTAASRFCASLMLSSSFEHSAEPATTIEQLLFGGCT